MLSIIIPCKDEPNILDMVETTEIYIKAVEPTAQIIISSDRYGRGKGWALRQGLREATGDVICFIDGDLDIHPANINMMLIQIKYYEAKIVVGRKTINGLPSRILISLCSRLFIGLLFGLWMDTQTGIKMFRRECLPSWDDDSFAFDIEILSKAKREHTAIKEIPVFVKIRKKMPGRSILRFIRGALAIRWKLWTSK